ncbi:MAG: DNA gyrase subunit A, partial [Candidatus Saganbacteria bacterium]|nr:DNA gyrase subunit A [Candidatus Saganbacteria bacterium]
RRSKFELKKAEEEAHILEGLRIAVANIDAIIKLIKTSKSPDEARKGLMEKFNLSRIQAQAILDMKLSRLTQLERIKIDEEYKKLKELIVELKELLSSRKKILGLVKKELLAVKDKYGDPRKTSIISPVEEIAEESLIEEVEVAVLITRDGYVKRTPVSSFRSQLRGGHGVAGMATREKDEIENIFVTSTHSYLLFFTNKGRLHRIKVYELPESSRAGKGQAVANLLQLAEGEAITAAVPVKEFKQKTFLVMATKAGLIKKTELSAFENIRKSGIIAVALKGDDELGWVSQTDGKREIILGTQNGMIIRFKEADVRPMGRGAAGVRGIRLRKGDGVVSMDIVSEGTDLLAISRQGYGKRIKIAEFKVQRRGGKGMTAMKLRKGDLIARMRLVNPDDELLFVTAQGTMSRQKAKGVSPQGRYAKGVRIQKVDKDDYIVDLERIVKEEKV